MPGGVDLSNSVCRSLALAILGPSQTCWGSHSYCPNLIDLLWLQHPHCALHLICTVELSLARPLQHTGFQGQGIYDYSPLLEACLVSISRITVE